MAVRFVTRGPERPNSRRAPKKVRTAEEHLAAYKQVMAAIFAGRPLVLARDTSSWKAARVP